MKRIIHALKAGGALLELLALYREGNWINIRGVRLDDLRSFWEEIIKQNKQAEKLFESSSQQYITRLWIAITMVPVSYLFFVVFSAIKEAGGDTVGAIFGSLILSALGFALIAAFIVGGISAFEDEFKLNKTILEYFPGLLSRLRAEVPNGATVDVRAFVRPLSSYLVKNKYPGVYNLLPDSLKKAFEKDFSNSEEKIEHKHYELSPSVQVAANLPGKLQLVAAIHEFAYERFRVVKVKRGKRYIKIKSKVLFVHEVVLMPAGELIEEIESQIKEGKAVRLFEVEYREFSPEEDPFENFQPSPAVTIRLLNHAYRQINTLKGYGV